MSMVIIGGHDRMIRQYKQICKEHQCKVKVFTQMSANMREQIGFSRCYRSFHKYGLSQNGTCCRI